MSDIFLKEMHTMRLQDLRLFLTCFVVVVDSHQGRLQVLNQHLLLHCEGVALSHIVHLRKQLGLL